MRALLLPLLVAVTAACSGHAESAAGSSSPTPTPTGTVTPTPTGSGIPTPTPTAAPVVCGATLVAGDQVVPCDGLDFHVRIPASCPAAGCGLVLDVHGLTMSGEMQDANTGMRALGEAHGFVVVQPDATPAPPAASWDEADYAKLHAFVMVAVDVLALDRDRVHVTGFSQGGQVTLAIACRWPEDFASAAPGAPGGGDCFGLGGTPPSIAVPMLMIHGTSDALNSFASGVSYRDNVISAFGLGGATVVQSGAGFARTRWTNASGMVLEFLHHDYSSPQAILGGHCYPGSTDPGGAAGQLFSFACTQPNGFTYGAEVMAFFVAHPRQGNP